MNSHRIATRYYTLHSRQEEVAKVAVPVWSGIVGMVVSPVTVTHTHTTVLLETKTLKACSHRMNWPELNWRSQFWASWVQFSSDRAMWMWSSQADTVCDDCSQSVYQVGRCDVSLVDNSGPCICRYYILREAKPRRNVYWARPSVCLCVCLAVHRRIPTLLHGPGYNLGCGFPLVVYYWAHLQSVPGFARCYENAHVCKFIALYTANAYRAEREMSASACSRTATEKWHNAT